MQRPKQVIQLSEHVKNKIRQYQTTPLSISSDELILSDNTDNDSLVSTSPPNLYRRRSITFTTYQIQQPSESDSFHMDKRIISDQKLKTNRQELCQECIRREHLLHNEQQRLLRLFNENKKLNEQLRSSVILNHQYQEENHKLKLHLTKMNTQLREYQMNFDLLKQKMISEKKFPSKENHEIDQLKRLRHEVQVYNQVIAAKEKEEQKQLDYFAHRNWIQKK